MKTFPMIEILEQRIAPAALLDARTLSFTDADGDLVTVKFGKDVFLGAGAVATANLVFKFDTGLVDELPSTQQQLRLIDLTKFPSSIISGVSLNGVSVTVTATQAGPGDGLVDVGAIKGTGMSVGKITIDGDLGQIDAGGTSIKIGLAGLTVNSMGMRGIDTQIPVPTPTTANPAPDLVSTITGELTFLKVLEDVKDAQLKVVDGLAGSTVTTAANIGSIFIGGSLLGRVVASDATDAVKLAAEETGLITSDRHIGAVVIGTDAADGITGGSQKTSGRIAAKGEIASLKISGGLIGGAGSNSGTVYAGGNIGLVTIGGDITGGAGLISGLLMTLGNLAGLTVGGDIAAGVGERSGSVHVEGGIKSLLVKGDIDGTAAGVLTGATPQLTSGIESAGVFANNITKVVVNGSIIGGAGAQSGYIETGTVQSGGSLFGGNLGAVTILGGITGGAGSGSGVIFTDGTLKSIIVKGAVTGGDGVGSGVIRSGLNPALAGGMGTAAVGSLTGGDGNFSGAIVSGGAIKSITLGSALLFPGTDVLKGGEGDYSGAISAFGKITTVKLFGNLAGGAGDYSGALFSYDRLDGDNLLAGDIGTVTIAGQFAGDAGIGSGTIQADGNITKLTVGAGLLGGTGADSGSMAAGNGLANPGNINLVKITGDFKQAATTPGTGSATIAAGEKLLSLTVTGNVAGASVHAGSLLKVLTVGGNVSDSSILAGYSINGVAYNPDAQIGTVKVAGNWTASNLVAGVIEGADAGFGNALDIKASGEDSATIVSKIASVIIGGTVSGAVGENFGFVAQVVAKMKVGTGPSAQTFVLDKLANSQTYEVGGTGSGVAIREVPLV